MAVQNSPRRPPPPSYPRSLNLIFAADPFDPRFVNGDAERTLTALGAVVNAWYYLHMSYVDGWPGQKPLRTTMHEVMQRECPDTLKELEDYLERNQTAYT